MNFQGVNDSFYNRILEEIDAHFPSFKSVFDKEDGIYPILGELGTFIVENFNQENIRLQAIGFINEAIEQGGSETEDAIVLEVFQKIYEDMRLTNEIKMLLSDVTLSVFDKYLKEYNN
ncbi:MAG: hypothetical protein J0M05_03475 [Candidatus Kapabacteria bacterium]|nr:hypothetical protein [Candidatus Kapabacteria bacterium]